MLWKGVIPAMTTAFDRNLAVDHEAIALQAQWMIAGGCTGIIALGSLGEAATLTFDEKVELLRGLRSALPAKVPLVAAISALATKEAVALANAAESIGCDGLMILPPYVYQGDWREMREHVGSVLRATRLSCMLYNNPIAYGTDFKPEQIRELAETYDNLHAVKESSADLRRVTAIRALLGERLAVFVGVDDAILEGVAAGAVGWVAGLVNALPEESVMLFDHASAGRHEEAFALYRWFLPLLRMDTVPKFVQLIKLVQEKVGRGSARVRPPRLELAGKELEEATAVIEESLQSRPTLVGRPLAGVLR